MIVDVREVIGSSIAAGAQSGRFLATTVLDELPAEPENPTLVFLDYSRIEVATASFLREGVLELRTATRRRAPNLYPILANANALVLDEILELAYVRKDAILACCLGEQGQVLRWQRIGNLDPKQREAFDLVQKYGETDAGELMRRHGGVQHVTAWNNRLSALSALGLVFEIPQGRSKRYRAIAMEA
jgi:hypothetical protein